MAFYAESRSEVYFLLKLKDKSGDVVKVQKMPKLPTLGVAWLCPYEFGQLKPPKFSIVLYYQYICKVSNVKAVSAPEEKHVF